jgi:hypothetical protein
MGFGLAGAAAGAQEGLQEYLTRKLAEAQQRQQMELNTRAASRADRALQLDADQQKQAQADREYTRKLQAAQIATSMARPGEELSPEVAGQIQGTPYAARLDTKETLPAQFGDPLNPQASAGGRKFVSLKPTMEQEQQQGERSARRRVVELFQRNAPKNEIVGALAEAGQSIPASELLKDPNRDLQDRLTEIAAQGAESRRTAQATAGAQRAPAPIGPRDYVTAQRDADAAATDHLDSLARQNGGFLPPGIDPDAVREQFRKLYLDQLASPTDRALSSLRQMMPGPVGSRQRPTVNLTPRASGRSVVPADPRGTSTAGDAYEQYLARQGASK